MKLDYQKLFIIVLANLLANTNSQADSQLFYVRTDGTKVDNQNQPNIEISTNKTCTTCGNNSCAGCQSCRGGCPACNRENRVCTGCFTCNNCSSISTEGCCNKLPPVRSNSSSRSNDNCHIPHSIFIPRSQGADTARRLVAWQEYTHRYTPNNYITTAHTLGYSRSFRPDRIARYLFGNCSLNFEGSQVRNRAQCALLADNFGLPTHFKGRLNINPIIDNIIFDNQLYIGLNRALCGLYLRADLPIVYTRWDLGLHEECNKQKCKSFPQCYMSGQAADTTCSILKALSGKFTFGNMNEPWQFGKFNKEKQAKAGIADLHLIAGWDFYQTECSHGGICFLASVPTGNKPKSRHIFEPIVGNAAHWELGFGITGHFILWEEGIEQSLSLWFEGYLSHMFQNQQIRSFDFCSNGPLSRYLLLKEFKTVNDTPVFTGNLVNAINFATRPILSTVPIKGDVSVKLAYRHPCVNIDLGYNFYGNAKEKVKFICNNKSADRQFGIKGTEGTCALEFKKVGTVPPQKFGQFVQSIPLNSTQNNATIRQGANTDNPKAPKIPNSDIAVTALSRHTGPIVGNDIHLAELSDPPILLTEKSLDLKTGRAGATATHKIFGYIGYTYENPCRNYIPFFGIGGELEVEAFACNQQTSLNQWSLWVKGGIAF